jgi:hypothetical protein
MVAEHVEAAEAAAYRVVEPHRGAVGE